jgi:hypothetical protein
MNNFRQLNSQIHRDILLIANAFDIGIGYVYFSGSHYGGYYTALLARPAPWVINCSSVGAGGITHHRIRGG